MHNLDQSITQWKVAMQRETACSKDDLEELEGHLREQIAALMNVGLSEQEAFSIGVSRLGSPSELGHEYAKASPVRVWRHWFYSLLLVLPALGIGAFVATFMVPKVQILWELANIDQSQSLLSTPMIIFESLFRYGHYALIAFVILMVLFDARATSWSRYRSLPFGMVPCIVNIVVLVGIFITCVALSVVSSVSQ